MRNYLFILIAALLLSACGEAEVMRNDAGVDSGEIDCSLVVCGDELAVECELDCEIPDPCEAVYDCEDPLALECDLACPDPCGGVVCGDAEAEACGLDCPPPDLCADVTCDANATCEPTTGECGCNEGYVGDGVTCALECDPTEVIGEELIGYRVYSATFSDHGWAIAEPLYVDVRLAQYEWANATRWENGTAYWEGGAFFPLETAEARYGSSIRYAPTDGTGSNYYFDLEAEDFTTCEGHCILSISVDIAKEFAPVYKTCE